MKIVSENRFSGMTYFYTIASRAHEELVIQRKKAKAWDTMRKQLEQRTKKKKGKAGKEEKSKTVTSVVKRPGVATRYKT